MRKRGGIGEYELVREEGGERRAATAAIASNKRCAFLSLGGCRVCYPKGMAVGRQGGEGPSHRFIIIIIIILYLIISTVEMMMMTIIIIIINNKERKTPA